MTTALATYDAANAVLTHEKNKQALAKLLKPTGIDLDNFIQISMQCFYNQPKLLECSPMSLMTALRQCATFGLVPSGVQGHAYLVPFRNNKTKTMEVVFIPGYRGLIELARRSGKVKKVNAKVVYEKDTFAVLEAPEEQISHTPFMGGDRGAATHYYAIAMLEDGTTLHDWMTRSEVERTRARSKGKDSLMWTTYFNEGGRKTVVRRLAKYLPLSAEFQQAVECDDQQYEQTATSIKTLNTDAFMEEQPLEDSPEESEEVKEARLEREAIAEEPSAQ